MLKKILIGLVVALILLVAGLRYVGVSVFALSDALDVSTGMSAKIACSGKFISGLSNQQIMSDLAAYSPANKMLDFEYMDNRVTTDFMGLSTASATFRKGLGCSIDYHKTLFDLDSLVVPKLTKASTVWPKGEVVNSIDSQVQALLDEMMLNDNAEGLDTRALVVVKDGQILAEAYGDGFTVDTPILGWSMGKSLTSIMLGNLVLKQKVNAQNTHLFPSWNSDDRKNISLESLLQMSSGLQFEENYIPGTDATRMLFLEPSASGFALAKPAIFEVGEHFAYSSGTSNILMRYIMQTLGGQPQQLVDYFYNDIAKPLGLTNTIFEMDSEGLFVGSSYIFATARDWARFGHVMVNQGVINNQQILSKGWITAAVKPNGSKNDGAYGYQFWLNQGSDNQRWPQLPNDTFAMLGSKKQRVLMFPSEKVVIVRLGWSGSYPDDENFSRILAALK